MGPPVRLLDEPGLTAAERSLFEDMSRPPVEYDIARGAVRFRTTLVALGAVGVAATAAKSASASGVRAVLGKLSMKLAVWMAIPSVVAGTAVAVLVAGRDVPVAPSPVSVVPHRQEPSSPTDERGAEQPAGGGGGAVASASRERSEPAERRGSGREASRGGKAPVNESEPAERRGSGREASRGGKAPVNESEPAERRGSGREASRGGKAPVNESGREASRGGKAPENESEPAERRGSGREASRGGKAPENESEPAGATRAERARGAAGERSRSEPRGQGPHQQEHAAAARDAAPLTPQRVELEETDESWPATAPAERPVSQPGADTAAKREEASDRSLRRPAPEPARATPTPREEAAEPARAAASAAPPSDTVREMQGIVRARSLLQTDPAAALAALDAVRRAYPRGFFVEERRALTIFALRRAGNSSAAKAQAAAFLKRYPDGPFTDKVRAVAGP